jgi:hypothetical protein
MGMALTSANLSGTIPVINFGIALIFSRNYVLIFFYFSRLFNFGNVFLSACLLLPISFLLCIYSIFINFSLFIFFTWHLLVLPSTFLACDYFFSEFFTFLCCPLCFLFAIFMLCSFSPR